MNTRKASLAAAAGAVFVPLALLIEGYTRYPVLTALFGAVAGFGVAMATEQPAPPQDTQLNR